MRCDTLRAYALVGMIATFGVTEEGAANPLDLFGNVIAAAQAQGAREAWSKLPEIDRFCLTRGLDGRVSVSPT